MVGACSTSGMAPVMGRCPSSSAIGSTGTAVLDQRAVVGVASGTGCVALTSGRIQAAACSTAGLTYSAGGSAAATGSATTGAGATGAGAGAGAGAASSVSTERV